jgi:hypothetical protein
VLQDTNKSALATVATDHVVGLDIKSIVFAMREDRLVVISGRERLRFVQGVVLLRTMPLGLVQLERVLGFLLLGVISRLVLLGIRCFANVTSFKK